jgi:hypothetical protein
MLAISAGGARASLEPGVGDLDDGEEASQAPGWHQAISEGPEPAGAAQLAVGQARAAGTSTSAVAAGARTTSASVEDLLAVLGLDARASSTVAAACAPGPPPPPPPLEREWASREVREELEELEARALVQV